ncbi:hypothetical protein AOLI_G00158460 [Acnodon oligacanthus]
MAAEEDRDTGEKLSCQSSWTTGVHPTVHGAIDKRGWYYMWSAVCQWALDRLKKYLSDSPVLVLPDMEKPFTLDTNFNNQGIGVALSQQH